MTRCDMLFHEVLNATMTSWLVFPADCHARTNSIAQDKGACILASILCHPNCVEVD